MPDIVLIGAGGLGCPALWALGQTRRALTLRVVDPDVVDVTNLHRQILFTDAHVGRPKAQVAHEVLAERFPHLTVEPVVARADHSNIHALIHDARVVLDGTDSFAAKFLINDTCVAARVPLVHGGVVRFSGQLMSVVPALPSPDLGQPGPGAGGKRAGSACVRCLFEAPPPEDAVASCQEAGILGPVAGVIGARMAAEALAILDGAPRLAGALDVFDALARTRRTVRMRPRVGCAAHLEGVV